MSLISSAVTHIAPVFIVTSPVTSYADQINSIYRTKSSAGFSLDIPLIMLIASILKLFYWLGARYDTALLIQAGLTILVQLVLLKVALDGRPSPGATMSQPFAGAQGTTQLNRPFDFWQWRWQRPYWMFLAYYTAVLFALQIIIGTQPWFVELQGYVALGIEATLPLPQILSNHRNKSCKGFRLSVLINWLIGDAFKMTFFFLSQSTIPWTFKLCGLFQAGCDAFLGVQYWMFGEGEASADLLEKDTRLS